MKTLIVSEQNSTVELLKRYLQEYEKFSFLAGTSDFTKAYSALCELSGECLVIVDASNYQEQALNFVSKISSEFKHTHVLVLSDRSDVNSMISAMRLGASDFLTFPVIKKDFFHALDKVYSAVTNTVVKKSKCRVISVYSNKGGIGKTSIATNLALELAKITKESVALIDLNFQLGDVATFLDLKPTFDISYMLENLSKITPDYLLSTLEKYKNSSLYVLADYPYFGQKNKVHQKDISKLFEVLRETFSYVIVDTAGGFDEKSITALQNSDLVFFTTIVNLPALRNCQRCLELFEKMGFEDEKVQILINRYMENDEIKADDIEKVLNKKLYWKIPNNYFTMMSAINKGVPVCEINPDSNVALSYKNLALMVSDDIYRKKTERADER